MNKTLVFIGVAAAAYGAYLWFQSSKKKEAPKGTTLISERDPVNVKWPKPELIPDRVLQAFDTRYTELFPSPRSGSEGKKAGAALTDAITVENVNDFVSN
jgi:hypothetical protein